VQHAFSLMALEKCLGSPFLRGTARSIAVGALISPSITFSFLLHSTATAAAAVGALPVVPSWLLQLWCELEALAGHGMLARASTATNTTAAREALADHGHNDSV
jgi:hypothetical protein